MTLAPCPRCARHVRSGDAVCPFCAVAIPARAPRARTKARFSRAAAFAGAAMLGTACGPSDATTGGSENGTGAEVDDPNDDTDEGTEEGMNEEPILMPYGAPPMPREDPPESPTPSPDEPSN